MKKFLLSFLTLLLLGGSLAWAENHTVRFHGTITAPAGLPDDLKVYVSSGGSDEYVTVLGEISLTGSTYDFTTESTVSGSGINVYFNLGNNSYAAWPSYGAEYRTDDYNIEITNHTLASSSIGNNGTNRCYGALGAWNDAAMGAPAPAEGWYDYTVDIKIVAKGGAKAVLRGAVYDGKTDNYFMPWGTTVTVTLSKDGEQKANTTVQNQYDNDSRFYDLVGTYYGYRFKDVETGTYTLTCSADGYETVSKEVTLAEGDNLADLITLQPVSTKADYTFSGTLTYIRGWDGVSAYVAGATVTAYANYDGYGSLTGELGSTTTDAQGNWSLTVNCEANEYVYFDVTGNDIVRTQVGSQQAYSTSGITVTNLACAEKQPPMPAEAIASYTLTQEGPKSKMRVKLDWTWSQELQNNYRQQSGAGIYSIDYIKVYGRVGTTGQWYQLSMIDPVNFYTLPAPTPIVDDGAMTSNEKFYNDNTVYYYFEIKYRYPDSTQKIGNNNSIKIKMSSAIADPDTATVTLSVNNPSWGTVTGGGNYPEGSNVEISASANAGYKFVEWKNLKNGDRVSSPTYTITNVIGDAEYQYQAVFAVKPDTVELTLERNDATMGTVTGAGRYEKGQQAKATATPNDGCLFVGWNEDGSQVSTDAEYTFTINADRTLTAVFKYDSVTLALERNDANMGTVSGNGKYRKSQSVTATAVANDGYKFVGWNENGVQVSDANPYTFNITGNRTLTAVFKYDTVELTLQRNDANMGTVSGAGKYRKNHQATATATANDGYKFVGWKEGETQVSTDAEYTFTITGNRTLTAVFKYDTVELTLQRNEDAMGTVTGAGKYRKNQNVTATAVANDGYKFVAWKEGETQVSTNAEYTFKITANRTLTAVFKYDTVTLTLQRNDANMGTVTGNGKYRKNHQATATATANDGYVFVGWNENGAQVSTANPYTFDITGNRTLMAVFKYDTVELKLQLNDANMGTVSGAGKYRKNENVTATATANDGYKFVNWKEGNTQASASNPYTFKITGNRTLTAVFKYDTVTLTLQRNDPDMGTVAGGGKYRKNQSVKITATPEENHVFVAWKEGETVVSTENPYTFNIAANRTLKAFFQPDSVTLDLSVGTPGRGTVEGAAKYQKGEEVSISAIADYAAGFVFDVWKNGDEVFSQEADTTFLITQNMNLAAYFKHDSVDLVLSPNDPAKGRVEGAGSYRRLQSVTIKAIPNTGYRWKEWRENDTVVKRATAATHTFTIQRNRNLVAVFVPDSVTLNLGVNDAAMGSVSGNGRYKRGTTAKVKATPNTNYVFVKWEEQDTTVLDSRTGVAATAEFTTKQLYNDRTLKAVFKRDSAVLTVKPNFADRGSVTGGGKYAKGQSVTVTATAIGDNEFVGWRKNNGEQVSTDASYTFTFTGTLTLTAYFKVPDPDFSMLTLTVNDADMGTADARGQVGGAKFEAGETVEITATPNAGYKFIEWQEGGTQLSTENPYEVEIAANNDRTITAVFAVKPDSVDLTLRVNNEEWGVVEGEGRYQKGESVVITASPSEDRVFVGWKDNDGQLKSTEETYRFNIESDLTLTAYFQPDSMDLVLEVNEARMGTVTGKGRYEKGQEVTITATPNDGYAFVEWKNGAEQFSDEREHTFEIDENLTLTACFQPDSAMLNLDVDDPAMGSVTGAGRYRRGTKVKITATPATGYKFVAWKEGETVISTNAAHTTKELTADRSLKAYFAADPVELTLTVDNAEAGTVQGGGTYLRNKPVVIKAIANPGYRFVAWEEEDGTEFATEAEYHFNIKKTRTLKAVFVEQVTLTLNANNDGWGTVDGTGAYDKDANATAKATPKEGYEFVGWEENGEIVSNDAEYTFAMEGNRTLTAIFAEKKVRLTLNANNDDWGSVEGEDTYGKGASATATAIPNDDYVFKGWQEDGAIVSTEAEYTFIINADRTLTAIFAEKTPVVVEPEQVTLTLEANNTDWGTVEGANTYDKGTPVTAKATPNEGYEFKGWQEDGAIVSTDAEYNFTIETDRTLTAIFAEKTPVVVEPEQVTLTLERNNADWGTVEGANTYDKGTPVTAKATPNEGYEFKGWEENGETVSTDNPYTFTIEANRTLTAIFAEKTPVVVEPEQVTLALEPNNADWGTVEGAGTFDKGTPVAAKAVANEGYEFKGWEENGETVSTDNPYTFTIEANRTLTAVFAEKPVVVEQVTLTLNVNDAKMGTVTGAGQYDKGAKVTAKAVANKGYAFKAWKEGETEVSTKAEYTFTLEADLTLTAVFEPTTANLVEEQAVWSVHAENRTIVLRSEAACRYEIYTISGKKVGQGRGDGKEYRMTVKNGGLYVVRCTTAGGMTTKKVVVR